MIVDDNYLVMGSANINDRSMLGSRDSELAVFIEGPGNVELFTGFDNIKVNGKIHEFRRRIFQEHFGVDIVYPTSDETWKKMWTIAATNTMVYNKIFQTYPSNEYPTFTSLANRTKKFVTNDFLSEIGKICGHAVLYPYEFLKNEALTQNKNSELNLIAVPLYALY